MRGLVVVMMGCAGASAQPAQPAAVGASTPAVVGLETPLAFPDEAMSYAIRFRGFQVARVQVAVGKPGWFEGRPAIIIKARGETDGVVALIGDIEWEMSTTVDLESGAALHLHEQAHVSVAGKTEDVERDRKPNAHTVLSAATVLRGWQPAANQHGRMRVRIDDAELDIDVHEVGRDFVAAQGKPAVRYAGTADAFPFEVWLSDDIARVPLAMKASTKWGGITVELVEYNAPRD